MAARHYTAQAKKWFAANGYVYAKSESLITPLIKKDLFGFMDYVALKPSVGIVGVQVTSGSNHSARRKKIRLIMAHRLWIICGGKILVLSFTKQLGGNYTAREEWLD